MGVSRDLPGQPAIIRERNDPHQMSPKAKTLALRCPTCKTIVTASDEDFPFCSDRCRKIDLGKWASGGYRISSPILDPDVLEDLESGKAPGGDD